MKRLLSLLGFLYMTWEDPVNGVVLVNGIVTSCRRIVVRKSQVVAPPSLMPPKSAIGLAQVFAGVGEDYVKFKWVIGKVAFRALP